MDVPDRPGGPDRPGQAEPVPPDAATVELRPVEPVPATDTPATDTPAIDSPATDTPAIDAPPNATAPDPVRVARGPNEIPLGGVLLAVLVGLALVGQDHWRRGLLLAGIGLLAGAVVRLILPARVAGLLAVRGRVFDTVVLAVLGTALIVLTSSVPLPPGSG